MTKIHNQDFLLFYFNELGSPPTAEYTVCVNMMNGPSNINPVKGSTVLENWAETGFSYSQNLEQAKWLNVTASIGFCTFGYGFYVGPDGDLYKDKNGYNLNSNVIYGQITLGFGDYVSVDFRTTGRVDLNLAYAYSWGETYKQRIRFRSYLDVHVAGTALYGYGVNGESFDDDGVFDDDDGFGNLPQSSTGFINCFQGRVDYTLNFHKNWAFNTELRLISSGDTSEKFRDNFRIRWNNTLNYDLGNGLSTFLTLRWQIDETLNPNENTLNTLYFITGVYYSFDLSKL